MADRFIRSEFARFYIQTDLFVSVAERHTLQYLSLIHISIVGCTWAKVVGYLLWSIIRGITCKSCRISKMVSLPKLAIKAPLGPVSYTHLYPVTGEQVIFINTKVMK